MTELGGFRDAGSVFCLWCCAMPLAGPVAAQIQSDGIAAGIAACVSSVAAEEFSPPSGWEEESVGRMAGMDRVALHRSEVLGVSISLRSHFDGFMTCAVRTADAPADPPHWLSGDRAVEIAGVRFDPLPGGGMIGCIGGHPRVLEPQPDRTVALRGASDTELAGRASPC